MTQINYGPISEFLQALEARTDGGARADATSAVLEAQLGQSLTVADFGRTIRPPEVVEGLVEGNVANVLAEFGAITLLGGSRGVWLDKVWSTAGINETLRFSSTPAPFTIPGVAANSVVIRGDAFGSTFTVGTLAALPVPNVGVRVASNFGVNFEPPLYVPQGVALTLANTSSNAPFDFSCLVREPPVPPRGA